MKCYTVLLRPRDLRRLVLGAGGAAGQAVESLRKAGDRVTQIVPKLCPAWYEAADLGHIEHPLPGVRRGSRKAFFSVDALPARAVGDGLSTAGLGLEGADR